MFDGIDPFTASPGELLAAVADAEPGPMVWSTLLMIDATALSPTDAVSFLQVHERISAWWASVQVEALVAAASPEPLVDEFTLLIPDSEEERTIRIAEVAREEIAAAVRWSAPATQGRIDTARLLIGPLAQTGAALALGEISIGHVNVLVDFAERLPGNEQRDDTDRKLFARACAALEKRVLPVARRSGLSATRASARRALLAIDARGAARRREQQRCTRDAWVVDELDGISTFMARMATEQAHAVLAQINAAAHQRRLAAIEGAASPDSTTSSRDAAATIGEHRADALAAMVLGGEDHAVAPVRAHLDISMDLPTLLGLRGALLGDSDGAGLAELRGCGPISAEVVAELLGDPDVALTIRRLVTDPTTGHLLDYGRTTYAVPDRLRGYLVARDQRCRFPGCRRRADLCQADHAVAWDDSGPTSPQNLGMLCVRHHQLKTFAGWEITESEADGSCTWVSPQGRRYDHDPPPF